MMYIVNMVTGFVKALEICGRVLRERLYKFCIGYPAGVKPLRGYPWTLCKGILHPPFLRKGDSRCLGYVYTLGMGRVNISKVKNALNQAIPHTSTAVVSACTAVVRNYVEKPIMGVVNL